MAPAEPRQGTLRLRVLSALVLAPVALGALWLGNPWFSVLTGVAAAITAWEWGRLCRSGEFGATGALVVATVLASVIVAAAGAPVGALVAALAGAAIVLAASLARREPAPGFTALGALWLAVPCIALLWLADDPVTGRATVLWIFAVVWATDIGAYVVGRAVGGPRLAPRMSPSKTWAGLAGGMAAAAVAGLVTATIIGAPVVTLTALSAALAVIEQFGDLAESVAKRRFGVKDSSALIPGHGGLLDRVDGLLAVVPAVALLSLMGGSSVLTWR